MEIYLIRHGECFDSSLDYFSSEKQTMDPPLTPKGMEQAHKLANRIKSINFDKIYSSDLCRAIETAEIIKTYIKTDIIITKNFREINMGEIFTKSWEEFPEIYSQWL
jgi:broad specificity phosphatase PhoE